MAQGGDLKDVVYFPDPKTASKEERELAVKIMDNYIEGEDIKIAQKEKDEAALARD